MKKYIFLFSILMVWSACTEEDRSSCIPDDLVTPDISVELEADTSAFTGILQVLPCEPKSSVYYGNYNASGLTPFNANYTLSNGIVIAAAPPVKLPVGTYNMLYWGVPAATSEDPTYDGMAIKEPPLSLGADLSTLYFQLWPYNSPDTTFYPVYDYAHAVVPIHIGSEKMKASLKRATAGLIIILKNKNGSAFDRSIDSVRIQVGSIAQKLNYFTAVAEDMTSTVSFPLTFNTDSTQMSVPTVMLFPSAPNPLVQVIVMLKNGSSKVFEKNMNNTLTAGEKLTLNITLDTIFDTENQSEGFTITDWIEKNENMDM